MSIKKPFVSLLTPTYNRRQFIVQYLKYLRHQDYGGLIEILIADDGTDPIKDLVISDNRIRYIQFNDKKPLGFKRNVLGEEAKGDILINIDDDDYYPPSRVSHAVKQLTNGSNLIAGSSHSFSLNTLNGKIFEMGPFGSNHGTSGTLAFFKEYLKNHKFDDNLSAQEEPGFTKNFSEPMLQLNPFETILIIQHQINTWDKDLTSKKPCKYKLKDFIKNMDDRRFYKKLYR